MTYKQAIFKQKIEYLLIFPIVLIGKIWGQYTLPKKKYTHFLFFPSADIGGSIKVNADIANCINNNTTLIIFSKTPKNNKFLSLFTISGVDILDLSKKIDNKLFHFINIFYRGVLSAWINKTKQSVVFGGESLYFYKVIPFLKKEVKVVELCHLNTWFNYSQAFIAILDCRIFSTQKIKRDVEKQYEENDISKEYSQKLYFIDNAIDIPPYKEVNNKLLEILYVGRGAPQKRVHLLAKLTVEAEKENIPVHFTFVGDVESYFIHLKNKNFTLLGQIKDRKDLEEIYNCSDALILTSAYEGLPLVVMDMMARGKIVISTAVDSIPNYIEHKENGLLLFKKEENEIVTEAIGAIKELCKSLSFKENLGINAYNFAKQKFSYKEFEKFFKGILEVKN